VSNCWCTNTSSTYPTDLHLHVIAGIRFSLFQPHQFLIYFVSHWLVCYQNWLKRLGLESLDYLFKCLNHQQIRLKYMSRKIRWFARLNYFYSVIISSDESSKMGCFLYSSKTSVTASQTLRIMSTNTEAGNLRYWYGFLVKNISVNWAVKIG
jgi:hypothetical protein